MSSFLLLRWLHQLQVDALLPPPEKTMNRARVSLPVVLAANQISETETETETSTFITTNFRKERNPVMKSSSATEKDNRRKSPEVRKTPTPAEIEEFFSELENDDKQKRFIEK
ncbi:unnamed protein product [Arabis nemorensis]|uniref:Cyclin-dependent kinase inhibitor n=1 Tax=Arabis nemorensis TaxID=586526 RepID=A0A565B965_9BRAS|nr:unnamed protein product [Arabis nemorensis]